MQRSCAPVENPMSQSVDVREAAARWFSRNQAPALSPAEQQAFAAWLAANADHRAEYAALERVWQAAAAIDPDRLRRLAVDESTCPTPPLSPPLSPSPSRRASPGWRPALLGLCAALAIGIGWIGWQHDAAVATNGEYQTAPGERRTLTLDDGSRIELNTRSRLEIHYSAGTRRVTLREGEAMFEVSHDAARPFVVDAGMGTVTVTGTRFDVRRDTSGVDVSVESGSVNVRGSAKDGMKGNASRTPDTRLSAGLGARIASDGTVTGAASIDVPGVLAWREGKLVFNDAPLSAVAAEVSRYRQQPVRVADAATGSLRVSSVFSADDTSGLLAALPQMLPVGVRNLPDGSTEIFSH